MEHLYLNKESKKTLLLLHGTGGNEYDLLQIANIIDNTANILSFRGNINENGMNRFFKRFGVGSYDLDSYVHETNNLKDEILKQVKKYNLDINNITVIGFSNGANIALGLIHPELLKNYALLSPDYINSKKGFKNQNNTNIFISTAENDPYVNFDNMIKLEELLKENNANVKKFLINGHQITTDVLRQLKNWYENN